MSSTLDSALTAQAVGALFKFEEKKQADAGKQSLVGYYAKPILAQIRLKEMLKKGTIRPVAVKIPHSLFNTDTEDHTVCLFCRSEDKKAIDEYIAEKPIEGLTKVISINEVRKLFSAYKDRKKLLSEHTHFICDANVMSQLYNLLGKTFADRNNSPIPINFKSPEKLQGAIMKACSSSYMHLKGQTITVRIGLTSMSESNVTENGLQGIEYAVSKFKGVWNDIRSIHLKTSDSPALPIYSKVPSELLAKMVKKDTAVEVTTVAPDVDAAAVVPVVKGKKGKAAVVVAVPVVAVIDKEESAVVEVVTKNKTALAKKTSKKISPVAEVSKPIIIPAIITPVVAAAAIASITPTTPGKKRVRPAAALVTESISTEEPVSKAKKTAKKIVKKA